MRLPRASVTLASLLVPALSAGHTGRAKAQATPKDPTADPVMLNAGFLSAHPDLNNRLRGLDAYRKADFVAAFQYFMRAAHYADKPAQAMVAEMYALGQGTSRDPVLAYAWMDLAAERGYLPFLAHRERYWNALSEAERERVSAVGAPLYGTLGDKVALPRIARVLRSARRNTTGSRVGFVGNLKIIVPGPAGEEVIDGSRFYDPKYWDPEKYQAWHDSVWMRPRTGTVSIGELQKVAEQQPTTRLPDPEHDPTNEPGAPGHKPIDATRPA